MVTILSLLFRILQILRKGKNQQVQKNQKKAKGKTKVRSINKFIIILPFNDVKSNSSGTVLIMLRKLLVQIQDRFSQ